jgi:undecaprenyl-diphosphatase
MRARNTTANRTPTPAVLVAALVFLVLFALLGALVSQGLTLATDQSLMLAVHRWTSPDLTTAFLILTYFGSLAVAGPICAIEAIVFYRNDDRVGAVVLVLALLTQFAVVSEVKLLYARPRPELWPHLMVAVGYSYPSGHATTATVAYGFSALLLARKLGAILRQIGVFILASVLIGIVGLSRIYLGVHYPTDVLGGIFLGNGWIGLWWSTQAFVQRWG